MNSFKKYLLDSCLYSILIQLLYFVLAALIGGSVKSLSFTLFLLIFIFSVLISVTNYFCSKILKKLFAGVLRYIILLSSFFVVFVIGNNQDITGAKAVAVISIFTLLYLSTLLAIFFTGNIKKSIVKKKEAKSTSESSDYVPLYNFDKE